MFMRASRDKMFQRLKRPIRPIRRFSGATLENLQNMTSRAKLFLPVVAGAAVVGYGYTEAQAAGGGPSDGSQPYGAGPPKEKEFLTPYQRDLWESKFKYFGYGEPIEDGSIWVHQNCLPNTHDRNISSREANRILAADPSTLPLMTIADVDRMSQEENRIVATYRGGVYDISWFVRGHPGGYDRILMANGNDLEPFWEVYKLHFRPHIQHLVEDYRIGNLSDQDAKKMKDRTVFKNMYDDEPLRPRSVLRMASERPCNSGCRLHEYSKQFFTPNELHYARNHYPVPRTDPDEYIFEVEENEELGIRGVELTLNDLKNKFKQHTVCSTLQCAGGRQEDFITPDRPLYVEAKWREDAWGTAKWKGTKVRDILEYCGLDVDAMALGKIPMAGQFLNAWGADCSETGKCYASFIPFAKAIDPLGDTIIAWEMNDQDVPRDHGYPCRLLAPGIAGFRNVKWVDRISVTTDEMDPECDQKNQHFGPEISFRGHYIPGRSGRGPTPDLLDVSAPRVCTVPVYSVITTPGMGLTIPGKDVSLRDKKSINITGIAWCGGGRGVNRVEVSIDAGNNCLPARLIPKPDIVREAEPPSYFGIGRCWTWQQWEIDYPLTDDMIKKLRKGERLELEIIARARDGDFNIQPESIEASYNVLGKCVNHWPRRLCYVDPQYKDGDRVPGMLPTPPSGTWVWSKNYPPRVDIDDPHRYKEEYEEEYIKTETPTPPRSEWW